MIMQKHDNFNDPLFIYLPLYTFIYLFFFFYLWFIANNAKYTLLIQKKKKFHPANVNNKLGSEKNAKSKQKRFVRWQF